MPKINQRRALVGVSVANPNTTRNIEVTIDIKQRIPFISMSQVDGSGIATVESSNVATLEYNKAFASKATPITTIAKMTNILVDPLMPTRFTTIGVVSSLLTQDESMLVYDAKYRDMILVPALAFLGDGLAVNLLSDMSAIVNGFQVGGSVSALTTSLYQDVDPNLNIPLPAAALATKSHLMTMTGFKGIEGLVNNNGIIFGTKYLESDVGSVIQFASIGGSVAIGGNVKTARMVRISNNSYGLMPMKAGPQADILILAQV